MPAIPKEYAGISKNIVDQKDGKNSARSSGRKLLWRFLFGRHQKGNILSEGEGEERGFKWFFLPPPSTEIDLEGRGERICLFPFLPSFSSSPLCVCQKEPLEDWKDG